MTTLVFRVPGIPAPKGSKRAFVRGGRAVLVESSERLRPWASAITLAARDAGATPQEGPLAVRLTFLLPRPKGHLGKRGLRPSAPAWPATRPDADKLARGALDALTGVAWSDDAQVVVLEAIKFYAAPEVGSPGLVIEIEDAVVGAEAWRLEGAMDSRLRSESRQALPSLARPCYARPSPAPPRPAKPSNS